MKKALFIDRDGTIVREPADEQVDAWEKLSFLPGVMHALRTIRELTGYEFIMVTNQDGLGTPANPAEKFWPIHNFIMDTLAGEGITFDAVHIDEHFLHENHPNRKPGIGMLTGYLDGSYDMANCYVIGDRDTDVQLAANLGCKALKIGGEMTWEKITEILVAGERRAECRRTTRETDIAIAVELDRPGLCEIATGLPFFDHMLAQIAHHGGMGLRVQVKGDLEVDAHHTVEDTALALGDCLRRALGDKLGISRYGYCLPMDDCLCRVALDFGGRPWLQWDVSFRTEMTGAVPTEMWEHFFKSLSDAAQMNLSVSARGRNAHHKIEGIFKAFARALRVAVQRDVCHLVLPSSKGTL
ncbi:MAG: bifunctional histidinol-phosphatase/imidazoleglycerol-phosphate dehydratase HisB [Akkermansia sp.]|nr:bifunctional histidinol-phosphatase/imidazoleglycerol-phosphate dehydratase HisB [Akkermansia sp.]